MSKVYGSNIKWSTVDAPKPMSGICEGFTYRVGDQVFRVPGESGFVGAVLHGKKGEMNFSSTPAGTVTALGVRAGAELTVSGYPTGKILVMRVSASWRRGQPMVFDATANHYPGLGSGTGTLTPGSITLSRTAGALQLPTDKVWWGTEGVPKAGLEGIVESCVIEESVTADETQDDDAEGSPIVAVVLDDYQSTARLEILTADDAPESGTEIDVFGGFVVDSAEVRWAKRGKRLVSVSGFLLPGVTDA